MIISRLGFAKTEHNSACISNNLPLSLSMTCKISNFQNIASSSRTFFHKTPAKTVAGRCAGITRERRNRTHSHDAGDAWADDFDDFVGTRICYSGEMRYVTFVVRLR